MESKVISCTCKHEFQDKTYGPGRRLANQSEKDGTVKCTVCGKEHKKK